MSKSRIISGDLVSGASALTHVKERAPITAAQMRPLCGIKQEVDAADGVGDAACHVRLWPRSKGDGRFRAGTSANARATEAYSSVRCARETASMSPTISSNLGLTIFGTVLRFGTGVRGSD